MITGKGYSVVDGERIDWQAGDLLLLPIKPGGVEHQHFNINPGSECRWIAFSYMPFFDHVAVPYYNAFKLWKAGDVEGAGVELQNCNASDWKVAALAWMWRRREQK